MNNKYLLVFEDYNGKLKEVLNFEAENYEKASQTAIRFIYKEQEALGFKIYYIRSWMHEGKTVFDYGSHSEFYHMEEIVNG